MRLLPEIVLCHAFRSSGYKSQIDMQYGCGCLWTVLCGRWCALGFRIEYWWVLFKKVPIKTSKVLTRIPCSSVRCVRYFTVPCTVANTCSEGVAVVQQDLERAGCRRRLTAEPFRFPNLLYLKINHQDKNWTMWLFSIYLVKALSFNCNASEQGHEFRQYIKLLQYFRAID